MHSTRSKGGALQSDQIPKDIYLRNHVPFSHDAISQDANNNFEKNWHDWHICPPRFWAVEDTKQSEIRDRVIEMLEFQGWQDFIHLSTSFSETTIWRFFANMHVENASHPHISLYSYVNGVKLPNITPKKLAAALDIPYDSRAVHLSTDWTPELLGDIIDTCLEDGHTSPFLVASLDETCKFLYSLTRNVLIPKMGDRTNVPRLYLHLFWALIHHHPVNLSTIICEEWIRTYNSSGKGIGYASALMLYLDSKKVPLPPANALTSVKGFVVKGDRKGKKKVTETSSAMDLDEDPHDDDRTSEEHQWEHYDPYLWEHVEAGQSSSQTDVPPGSTVAGIRFLHGKIKDVDSKIDALTKEVGDLRVSLEGQINNRYDDMHASLDSQMESMYDHINHSFDMMEDRMLEYFNHIPGFSGPTPHPPPTPPPGGNM